MAPTMNKATAKRKAPTFKPQRPGAPKTSKSTLNARHRASLASSEAEIDRAVEEEPGNDQNDSGDFDDDDMDEPSHAPQGPDDASEIEPNHSQNAPPSIPPALLTKLFHHHFQDSQTRIGIEARGLAGKYMETFVREAIARAAFERQSGEKGTRGVVGDDFLEVEDLEKLAPQLLLDF